MGVTRLEPAAALHNSHFADASRVKIDRARLKMEKMASAVVAIAGKAIKGEEGDGDRRQVGEREESGGAQSTTYK